jgi:polysaccharide pyruvyl transferase WcaK-like protein
MDPLLARMCRRYCGQSFIITRNEESLTILSELGVPTELGTDTAWTFEPRAADYGQKVLREAGWDGSAPVLVLCPINPFWWPVKASVAKYVARALTGAYRQSHYRSLYFHRAGPKVDAAYTRYLGALANAVDAFRKKHKAFLVLVAMERLDTKACRQVAEQLGGVPIFTSEQYDMYQLVGILRCCHLMVSSRYHGIVASMPALVPSVGVTMDERIRNLMRERGHDRLLLDVDDADLESKLLVALDTLCRERDAIRDALGRTVVKNLKAMARMGVYFERHLQQRYPEFPVRSGLLSWEDYLPPLSPTLRKLVESYGE